jgi:Tol biopolymer transport system component
VDLDHQPPDPERRKVVAVSTIFALAMAGIGLANWHLNRRPIPGDGQTLPPATGRLIFMGEKRTEYYSLFGIFTARADGSKLSQLTEWQCDIGHPSWSSDGTKIIFSSFGKAGAILVMNPDGRNVRPFGLRSMDDLSPDETRIAKSVAVATTHRIVVKNVDRTDRRPVTNPAPQEHHRDPVWSPDGSKILFERHLGGDVDLLTVNQSRRGWTPTGHKSS